jgi:hypothetical protein
VQRLFEQRRFRVRRNPSAAGPRQTDLMATRGEGQYLIEVKWRSSRADINDIVSHFDRLQRVSPDIVGVFVSMSGYTKKAIEEVQAKRSKRRLLLFGADEIRALVAGQANLVSLLRRKKQVLDIDGRVFIRSGEGLWGGEPSPERALLPLPEWQIRHLDDQESPWFTSRGQFGPLVFSVVASSRSSLTSTRAQGPQVRYARQGFLLACREFRLTRRHCAN